MANFTVSEGGKKMFKQSAALIVCTLFSLLATPHFAQSSPMLEFVGTPTTIGINETFSLDIALTGMTDSDSLSTFDFIIDFDPAILAISGYTFGNGLLDPFMGSIQDGSNQGSGTYNFSEVSWVLADDHEFSFGSTFYSDQFDGSNSLILLTLDFTSLAFGSSDLTIIDQHIPRSPLLGDEYGEEFEAIIQNSSVKVAPVPEPSTMLLFGAGIACLAGFRRRNNSKKNAPM